MWCLLLPAAAAGVGVVLPEIPGDGAGAWVEIHLIEPTDLSAAVIRAGYHRRGGGDPLLAYGRPTRVAISIDGGAPVEAALDGLRQGEEVPEAIPLEAAGARTVRVEVIEVAPGARIEALAISEIRLVGP